MAEAQIYFNVVETKKGGYCIYSDYPGGMGIDYSAQDLDTCMRNILWKTKEHGVAEASVKSSRPDFFTEKSLPMDDLELLILILNENEDGIKFE